MASHTLGIALAVVIIGCLFAADNARFASFTNLGFILQESAILGIMATGMTFAIVSGEIDLSVGSMFAVTAMVFALALQASWGLGLALVAAIGAGLGLGLCNGLLSVAFNVPSIIITLGTLSIYSGIALWISNGLPVSNFASGGGFFRFSQDNLTMIPYLTWVPDIATAWLASIVLGWIVLTKTSFGQRVYATGSNRQAAINAGISHTRVRIQTLAIVGFTAAVAGSLSVGEYTSASPGAGAGFNLSVIAAVIIGGAALTGGRGSVMASAIGVLLIGEVNNGIIVIGVNVYGQLVAQGALVVMAVAIDRLIHGDTWYVATLRREWRGMVQKFGLNSQERKAENNVN